MSIRKKLLIGLILILFSMTLGVYIFGVVYFTNHFLPGSIMGSWNCSYMTEDETEDLLARQMAAYVLAIDTRNGGRESITAEEAGAVYASDGSVKKMMKAQKRFSWFLAFDQSSSYEMPVSVSFTDPDLLEKAVYNLKCMQPENTIEPSDAQIVDTGNQFELIPEVQGNALDKEKTLATIRDAISKGIISVNLEDGCYIEPSVYVSDDMVQDCERMNQLTSTIITYDFADATEIVDYNILKNWLIRDGNGEYTIDRTKAAAFVAELAKKYDTYGKNRNFRTYDGREVTIIGGDYGWVIAQTAETEALMQALLNQETQVREPIYASEGYCRDTSNDIGYTYIEIDLTNQRMVLYINGQPTVDTAILSGNPAFTDSWTPRGCYSVKEKESPAVITGEEYPSQVNYWIAFYDNIGINDAPWRTQFGSNLYLIEGSRGCINAPTDKMYEIYQRAEKGMPVIIYE